MKDWNINDSKHLGYIQNRTHWKENGQPLIAVGTPDCGLSDLYNGPIVSFTYEPGTKISAQLDDTTNIPIYSSTVIEIMWSAPDKNGNRTVLSYNPVEVFYDEYLTRCLTFLGGAEISLGGPSQCGFAKVTDSCNPETITEIRHTILDPVIDPDRWGTLYGASQHNEDYTKWWSPLQATSEQIAAMQEYVNTVGYNIAGGTLVGESPTGSADVKKQASFMIVNPNNLWFNAWGVSPTDDGTVPVSYLHNGSTNDKINFFLIPDDLTDTKIEASVKLEDLGISQFGQYTPVTYHTIPMEFLPQDIQDMYAWYQENYDTIQATITAPSEPDPGIAK